MRGSPLRRLLLVSLLAALPGPARAYDELDGAPAAWPAADRAAFQGACATLRLAPALCECFLEALPAHFPSYDAFQRNRDRARDRTADLELRRCADRFRR